MKTPRPAAYLLVAACCCAMAAAAGCGVTKSQQATEQLLMSDAVDRAVADVDFRDLAGEKVYFDTQYINNIKGLGFVNDDYIISSLRQQMTAASCRLQDQRDEADFIVEARVGALGTDSHEVTYGFPASNAINTAANLMPNAPAIPPLPELALGKRNNKLAAAKIAVFAYDRQTRQPVWQSGISRSKSTAKDAYVLGAGPFQRGTIYDGTQFAGSELRLSLRERGHRNSQPVVAYESEAWFPRAYGQQVSLAGFEGAPPSVQPQLLMPNGAARPAPPDPQAPEQPQ